jgi:6-phosphofructokinase 1
MNACVRGVVRTAVGGGHEVVGVRRGYQGLLDEDFFLDQQGQPQMRLRSVSGWCEYGGAFLRSSRSEEFRTHDGQQKAAEILTRRKIDALIPIGGDGTLRGAIELAKLWNGQIIGCPGTIDNDLIGSDNTIGFSTAVQTAVEAVDKLRDTAESHERMFLVEVMGRHSGYIALYTALAAGAEVVCVPETHTDIPAHVAHLKKLQQRGKRSIMMIVAEGEEEGGVELLQKKLEDAGCPFSCRSIVLGHLQRGGAPTPEDRMLAARLGVAAVRALENGDTGKMAGIIGGDVALTPFAETCGGHKLLPPQLLDLVDTLAQ